MVSGLQNRVFGSGPAGAIPGALIPVSGMLLDPFDREQRFTVGYHVTAIRAPAGTREVK